MSQRLVLVPVLLACLAGFAPPLWANPAIPPERPRERQVRVTLADGGRLTGTLLELSPTAVTMLVKGDRQEYRLAHVSSIQRSGDSILDGALIGAAVVGGFCLLTCGQGLDDSGDLLGTALVVAGLGAVAGMGIDAMHSDRTVVYRSGPRPPRVAGRAPRALLSYRVRF